MMGHVFLALLTYAAFIGDAGSGSWSLPAGTAPQFLLMVAAVALLNCRGAMAIVWAVIAGLLIDSLSTGPMGLNVVLLANLVFFGQIFGTRAVRDSVFASGAAVWVFVTVASFSGVALQTILAGQPIDLKYLSQYAAGRAGGTVAIVMVVLLSLKTTRTCLRWVFPSVKVRGERGRWATGEA